AGDDHEHVEEVREVSEVVEGLDLLLGPGRQRVVVPPRHLEQRLRPHRPLEVDVQLDLRVGHSVAVTVLGSRRQRGSKNVARPIESALMKTTATTERIVDTGST